VGPARFIRSRTGRVAHLVRFQLPLETWCGRTFQDARRAYSGTRVCENCRRAWKPSPFARRYRVLPEVVPEEEE